MQLATRYIHFTLVLVLKQCSVSCQHGDHSLLQIDGTGGSLGVIRVMMLVQCGGGSIQL